MRHPRFAWALALFALALPSVPGCNDVSVAGLAEAIGSEGPTGSRTSASSPSPSPSAASSPQPTPTPSPTPTVPPLQVSRVTVSPSELFLNAMPETGEPEAGFVTAGTLTATVTATGGTPRGVSWSSSNTGRVMVTGGQVQTVRGASKGTVVITATSLDDPRVFATASVLVTIEGNLGVEVN